MSSPIFAGTSEIDTGNMTVDSEVDAAIIENRDGTPVDVTMRKYFDFAELHFFTSVRM
jgi:hypothetical protein